MNLSKLSDNQQTALLLATVVVGAFLSQGCNTIHIVFTGTDSGPMPMMTSDAGVPMGDGAMPLVDAGTDTGPIAADDAGTDSGPVVEVDAGSPVSDLTITTDNLRQSTIIVAGASYWNNVSQYRLHVESTSTVITDIGVRMFGDSADVSRVAIAQGGVVLATATMPSGVDMMVRIELLDRAITVEPGTDQIFQIWVEVPPVVAGSAVSGATIGFARSGDRFSFGVYHLVGRAGSSDFNSFYVAETLQSNEFIIRKTRPTVTRQTLSSTTLGNRIDQDLYKLQVSADSAGSVGLHTIVSTFNPVCSSTVSFDNFRIRREATDLPFSDYQIVDAFGRDVRSGSVSLSPTDPNHRVAVVFNYEQIVSGSGNVYTLHATTRDADSGDVVEIYFDRSTGSGATGYLPVDPLHYSLDFSPWGAPGSGFIGTASFIWSDLSETPHSDFYGTGGGSRDWTDLLYVEDL